MKISKFEISKEVNEKYPYLARLIVESREMDDSEKQYCFEILSLPLQVEWFEKILTNILEKEKQNRWLRTKGVFSPNTGISRG